VRNKTRALFPGSALCSHTFWFVVSAILFLSGCPKPVILPESDSTPPLIEMIVSRETRDGVVSQVKLTPTSSPVHQEVCLGDTIIFSANAIDLDGGVRSVAITGAASAGCSDEDIGLAADGLYNKTNTAAAANPGDEVSEKRSAFLNIPVASSASGCPMGYSYKRVSGTFRGRAYNYYGGEQETSTYTFTWPPNAFSCSSDPCWVPPNATLLDTVEESCGQESTVQVNQHATRESIDAGECQAFAPRPSAQPVSWWCVGPSEPIPRALEPNETDCPQNANFIRVIRPGSGNDFRIECYHRP
jgi:hypothetical protein